MAGRSFKDMMAEAQATIDNISVQDALGLVGDTDTVFVDVREQHERQMTGGIDGAEHAPRGFLEFIADAESPMHNPALASGKRVIVYCASGGRSVLATKTLRDMGIERATNLVGGFQAWSAANGPVGD